MTETSAPAAAGGPESRPPASTRDYAYGLVAAFGLIVLIVLLLVLLIGVLTGFTFDFCGCTTQPAPSPR